jgi:proteic killer suppression protein
LAGGGTLRVPIGMLERRRKRQHSIRINDQFRICFVWTNRGPADVEIADYH